jgi:hypothetical protein
MFLIIAGIAKKKNVGNIVRSAAALGVDEVCLHLYCEFSLIDAQIFLCGSARTDQMFGAHGADRFVKMTHFPTLQQCVTSLRAKGFSICVCEFLALCNRNNNMWSRDNTRGSGS